MTEQSTRRRRQPKVPYAPWAQVKQFLDKIRVLNPKTINASYLTTNQMGGQQPSPLLNTIQFLGLINAAEAPTSKLESLKVKGEEQYQRALESIVREAYHVLFEALDVSAADRDMIYNQIRSVYGCSPRVADTATPLFLGLCREANMNVPVAQAASSGSTERRTGQEKPRRTAKQDGRNDEASKHEPRRRREEAEPPPGNRSSWPDVHLNIQIHIDSSASPEQIDHIFASMARHLGKQTSE